MAKKSKYSIENIRKHISFPKIDSRLSEISREHIFVLNLLSELSDLKPNMLTNLYKDITGNKLKESRHDIIYKNVKKEVFSVLKIKESRKDNMYSIGNIKLVIALGSLKKKEPVGRPYLSKSNQDKFSIPEKRRTTVSEEKKSTAKKKSKFAAASTKKTSVKKKSTAKKVEAKKKSTAKKKVVEKKSTTKKKVGKKKESMKDKLAKKKASIKSKKETGGSKKKVSKKKSTSEGGKHDIEGTIVMGEGVPKMDVRKDMQAMVGSKGMKMQTLVDKAMDEFELSEKRIVNHINGMIKKGFIEKS